MVGLVVLIVLLLFHADSTVEFLKKIWHMFISLFKKLIYNPICKYWKKRNFERNKKWIINQYKIQAEYERKEAFNRLKHNVKNQISENIWEKELYTVQYEKQYWWLDYLRDEQGRKDQIYWVWKRNTLQHLFDL